VSHNLKPFVNRVRYVPEVASKPGRIEKELANVKILASILEEEYVTLFKSSASSTGDDSMETNGVAKPEDVGVQADNEDDPMLAETGSEAVERRIEKLVGELHEQGVDEKVLEAKKVSRVYVYTLKTPHGIFVKGGDFFGFVYCLPARSVPHLLLLRCCYRSSRRITA
jgi:hypothetical protein